MARDIRYTHIANVFPLRYTHIANVFPPSTVATATTTQRLRDANGRFASRTKPIIVYKPKSEDDNNYIRIDKTQAKLYSGGVLKKAISIDKLIPKDEILPRGLIYIRHGEAYDHYVIEVEPQIKTLRIGGTNYKVAMPWQYFVFPVTNEREPYPPTIFWSKSRVKSTTSKQLIPAILSDVSLAGDVCLGNTYPQRGTRNEKIEDIVNRFSSDTSRDSQSGGQPLRLPQDYPSIREWVEASKKDPQCYLKWTDWEKPVRYSRPPSSIEDTLERYRDRYSEYDVLKGRFSQRW